MINSRSIQVRLTFWYTVLVIATSIGFGTYTYSSFKSRLYEEMKDTLGRRILHLREDVLPDISAYSPEALSNKIHDVYSPEENGRFIRITNSDGNVLYISGMPQEKLFNPQHIPLPQNYTKEIKEPIQSLRTTDNFLLEGFVSEINGRPYIFEMGASTMPIQSALHKLIITLLIGLPIVTIIAIIGGLALVRRALQPVEDMRAIAVQISSNNLQQRLPITETGDAIESLSRTLNQMLERLDQAYQQASRFSADASHELRTPLAIMRSEIEIIVQEKEISNALRERIGSVLEEAERLSNIVEGLFSLARLDAGHARIDNGIFDLSELTRSTLEQMQLLADDRKLSVIVESPDAVLVMGDSARVKQVIVNLLDNAIKYTMPGGAITIAVVARNSTAILTIKDNGIGIPSKELPHIFERFYRVEKVRSENIQGAGLGLSIVQAICLAHGGSVEVTSQEGAGTILTVEFPLASQHDA